MSKPVNIAATATSQSQPPLATQVQAQTANDSLQNYLTKQSEFQQPPLHSQDDSISNLRQISGALLAVHRCLTELQQHVDSIRTSIDSMLPPHTTNTAPLTTSSPQAAASPAPAADTTSTPVPVPESSWESDPSEEEEEEEEVRSSPRSELISTHRSELETLCEKEEEEEEDVRSPPRSELISTHRSELESLCDKKVKVEDKEEEDARCPPRSELISTHHSELESLCNKEVIEEDKEEKDVRCPPRSEVENLCDKKVKVEDKEEEDARCPPRSELISTHHSELESLCNKEVIEEDKEEKDVRCPPRSEVENLCDKKVKVEDKEEEDARCPPRSELISTHHSELESLCNKEVIEEDKEEKDVRCPPRSEVENLCDKKVKVEDKEEEDARCPPRSELESLCDKEVIEEDKEEKDVRCPPRSELESLCDKEVIEEDKEEEDVRCPPRSELESLCDKEVIEEDKEEEDVRFPPRSELISTHRSELISTHRSELESLCEKEVKEDKEEEDVRFPPRSELISTPRSELESLCEMMDGRGLRRYMVMHLLDIKGLLEQVPKALRLSSNPARLVLECVGKFYTQKGKAFVKGSQMVQSRKASVLVLQCFLLMGISDEIEIGVKQEAEQAALAWRKRLIAEAGILKAEEIDARGLLMLVGCFGIPGRFKNEDIRDLIWVIFHGQGRIRKILFSGSLRRSNVLVAKIPDIIEGMAMQKMEVDAAHIAYTFGIEDRVSPQRFLTSFLLESEESLKKMVEQSQGSLAAVDQAKRKHLFDLRSVIKCLGHHDIDPSELLPRWQINEKIMSLEKEITVGENLNKKEIARGAKMAQKRKIDETESSRWFSNKEPKHSHVSNPWLQQERVDSTPGQIGSHTGQLYGRLGNAAMYDGLASCSYTHLLSYLYWPR
nr:uncharacterized protein LOC104119363 [Nicotiana tomentosiformis]